MGIVALNKMKILKLTLVRVFYDQILAGTKKIEYREIKPYWFERLVHGHDLLFLKYTGWQYKKHPEKYGAILEIIERYLGDLTIRQFDAIEFKNGYASTSPSFLIECKNIHIGPGNPDCGIATENGKYFCIELGDLIANNTKIG